MAHKDNKKPGKPPGEKLLAEWEGFEPSLGRPTNDLANRPLQPLEYHSDLPNSHIKKWQGQKDLNPQPMVLETTTLPIELYPCIKPSENGYIHLWGE